jgi:hypothetical protein
MTPSVIEPATFLHIVQCFNELRHCLAQRKFSKKINNTIQSPAEQFEVKISQGAEKVPRVQLWR